FRRVLSDLNHIILLSNMSNGMLGNLVNGCLIWSMQMYLSIYAESRLPGDLRRLTRRCFVLQGLYRRRFWVKRYRRCKIRRSIGSIFLGFPYLKTWKAAMMKIVNMSVEDFWRS